MQALLSPSSAALARRAAVAHARDIVATMPDPYTGQLVPLVSLPAVAQLQADEAERAHYAALEQEAAQELLYGAPARLAAAFYLEGR